MFIGGFRGLLADIMDYKILVNEFELQSHYYVHFRTSALGKGINLFIHPSMGQIVLLLSFYKSVFGIK